MRVAEFDTSNEPDARSFKGAWGVYPFLPSGNILVADMQEGLFVFEAFDESDCPQRRQMCRAPVSSTSVAIDNKAFTVLPNPAHDFITLSAQDNIEASFEVSLMDIAGRKIANRQVDFTRGTHIFELSNNIAPGMYLLSVTGKDFIFTEKVIIE